MIWVKDTLLMLSGMMTILNLSILLIRGERAGVTKDMAFCHIHTFHDTAQMLGFCSRRERTTCFQTDPPVPILD